MENLFKTKFSENFKNIPSSFIREILSVADQREMISFAGGLPNPNCFPSLELAESANYVLTNKSQEVLQYAGSQGLFQLRSWIASRYNMKYNMNIDPKNIVITNGSQQTLDIVSKMFIEKGDSIIVEKPTYLGAIQAMSGYLPQFLPVNLSEDGLDFNQIESFCLNDMPKFMYCIPNFQNPSGMCYNYNSRFKVAELIKRYGIILLEDDPYNEIRFNGDDLPPIVSMAPNNVIWTGSFSKMVAPGLRMGWVVLPDGLAPHFIKAKQSTDLHSNNLSQYVLLDFFTRFDIDDHLVKTRAAYKCQCNTMKEMIDKYFPDNITSTSPDGGMFLWLTLPEQLSSEELIGECLNQGVAFVPGRSFFTDGKGDKNIRMNFSNSDLMTIEKGIKIMATIIKNMLSKKNILSAISNKTQTITAD